MIKNGKNIILVYIMSIASDTKIFWKYFRKQDLKLWKKLYIVQMAGNKC